MYYPCPDRKDRKFEYDMKPFLVGKVEDAFRDVQCCGLGGCAAGKRSGCGTGTDRPCKSIEELNFIHIVLRASVVSEGEDMKMQSICYRLLWESMKRYLLGKHLF